MTTHTKTALLAMLICFSVVSAKGSSKTKYAHLDTKQHNMQRVDSFKRYLHTDFSPADGFSHPFGKKRGEFRNVYAVANGRVVNVTKGKESFTLFIKHLYFENHEKKSIVSVYSSLKKALVQKGDTVRRRQKIGLQKICPRKTCFKFTLGIAAESFIDSHKRLFTPASEKTLVLVDRKSYRLRVYYNYGLRHENYRVSFGQNTGQKRIRGDYKTPKGMYFVVYKHKGQFKGDYGEYYGGYWLKINYPNKFDARYGLENSLISSLQAQKIRLQWQKRTMTWQGSKLGGGIGFHGWVSEWKDEGDRPQSWGCIVMHNKDIEKLYPKLPLKTMVIIF